MNRDSIQSTGEQPERRYDANVTVRRGYISRVGKVTLSAMALCSLVVIVASTALSNRSEPPVRVIVLEARDLRFDGTNPTLHAKVNERLRIVVRNFDMGVTHAVSIPALDTGNITIRAGQTGSIDVTFRQAGEYAYVCSHHMPSMQGKIIVSD